MGGRSARKGGSIQPRRRRWKGGRAPVPRTRLAGGARSCEEARDAARFSADRRRSAAAWRGTGASQPRRSGRPAGRRQDHAGADLPAGRAVCAGQAHPAAGAAAAGGARRGGAHGGDARRAGRPDHRPARSHAGRDLGEHPPRGRHRRRVHPDDPRRSGADGGRRGAIRRVPRALARRRSRPRAGARRARGAARRPAAAGDVGDARRGARRAPDGRRAAGRQRGPRLSRRDALCRARPARAHRGRGCEGRARRPGRRARFDPGVSAGPKRDHANGGVARSARPGRQRRHRAALWRDGPRGAGQGGAARPRRTAQGDARHFDRRDLADHRGRARRRRQRAVARPALRARHRRDAAGDPAGVAGRRGPAPRPRRTHRTRRLLPAVGGGGRRRAGALRQAGNPVGRSLRNSCSIWPPGASPTRPNSPSSIRRPRRRSPKRAPC